MNSYKICRYDLSDHSYVDLWTRVWDFYDEESNAFNLTEEYFNVENQYVNFAVKFFEIFAAKTIPYRDLENNVDLYIVERLFSFDLLLETGLDREKFKGKTAGELSLSDLSGIIKLCLRGVMWCQLDEPNGFGGLSTANDYYLIAEAPKSMDVIRLARDCGLYAYPFKEEQEN